MYKRQVLTCTFLLNVNIPANSTEKEVKVYSGRHYNTDRSIYKKFAEETGIKVRLIEAAGISLIERLKREGNNSQADLILLVDAARITNAAKAGLLQPVESSILENDVPVGLKDPDNEWYALTRSLFFINSANFLDNSEFLFNCKLFLTFDAKLPAVFLPSSQRSF